MHFNSEKFSGGFVPLTLDQGLRFWGYQLPPKKMFLEVGNRAVSRFSVWGCNWPSEARPAHGGQPEQHTKRAAMPVRLGSGGASPQRGPGAAPRWGSRGRSPQKFVIFLSIFDAKRAIQKLKFQCILVIENANFNDSSTLKKLNICALML